jgi:hypothetical protein
MRSGSSCAAAGGRGAVWPDELSEMASTAGRATPGDTAQHSITDFVGLIFSILSLSLCPKNFCKISYREPKKYLALYVAEFQFRYNNARTRTILGAGD